MARQPRGRQITSIPMHLSSSRRLRLCSLHFYTLGWIVAAVVHTCQTIVFSLGDRIPGSLVNDARFVNLILAHADKALQGAYDWWSPAQFYPHTGTLVYSDNHFGTFLLYSLFRFLGCSVEGAFQGWHIALSLANAVSAVFLLRTLKVKYPLCGPLAFVGVSSFALVGKLGHPQLLPLFPFLFGLAYLMRFLKTHQLKALSAAVLWYAYQHYCYQYFGYFATLLLSAVVVAFSFTNRTWIFTLRRAPAIRPWGLAGLCLASATAVASLVFLYAPYASFASMRGWTNPIESLRALAPDVGAWFTAQYASTFYPNFVHTASHQNIYEKCLFPGFLMPVLVGVSMVVGYRARHTYQGKFILALGTTSILTVVCITNIPGTNFSLYLFMAEHAEPIRAFRAFSRIAYLLYPMAAAAIGLLLTLLHRSTGERWKQNALVVIPVLLCIEGLATRQSLFSYSKAEAQERASAVVTRVRSSAREVIALVSENKVNGSYSSLHLDAFEAALLTGRFCVNGYSGSSPESHWSFLANPDRTTLNALLLAGRLAPFSVDVYTVTAGVSGGTLTLSPEVSALPDRRAAEYSWGEDVFFRPGARSSEFVLSGFVGEGGDWRWTLGRVAVLELLVQPLSRDVLLAFEALPLLGGRLKKQIVTIGVNGHPLKTLEMTEPAGKEYRVLLPSSFAKSRKIRLSFEVPYATTPASLGIGRDRRTLGIAFRRLKLLPLPVLRNGVSDYSWGERVIFQDGGRSDEFIVSGFVEKGGEWRWTAGSRSILEFKIKPERRERILHLEAIPLVSSALKTQRVVVSANGHLVGAWSMANPWGAEYALALPAGLLEKASVLRLEFEVPNARSPASLGINDDKRVLGIAIRKLWIE